MLGVRKSSSFSDHLVWVVLSDGENSKCDNLIVPMGWVVFWILLGGHKALDVLPKACIFMGSALPQQNLIRSANGKRYNSNKNEYVGEGEWGKGENLILVG